MSEDKRKISDVIILMEAKLNKLIGLCQNIDNNNKIIIDKLNKVMPKPPQVANVSTVQKTSIPIEGSQKNIKNTVPVEQKRPSIVAIPAVDSPVTELTDEITEETVAKGMRRDLRAPVDPKKNKKITVSQQLLMPDGKVIFMAGVQITDSNGKQLKAMRTNTAGKWMAPLEPGDYSVHVVKRQQDKLPIDLRYNITIPQSDTPLELPTPELSDIYKG